MNAADFERQFSRLTDHFHLPADASRDTIAVDWFAAVEHYHVDALERGVTELIRTAQDRFWPSLGKLLSAIKGRMAGMAKTKDDCSTCGGSTWIEAAPWKSYGIVYTGFQRCPDCGVPAPAVEIPRNREEWTASEFQAWREGTLAQPPILTQPSNASALEALRALRTTRGRMAKAIEGAPQIRDGAA